jgi:hypothetical protein
MATWTGLSQTPAINVGAVWFFTRSGGVWTQQGAKVVATGGVGSPPLGKSVALSALADFAQAGLFPLRGGVPTELYIHQMQMLMRHIGREIATNGIVSVDKQKPINQMAVLPLSAKASPRFSSSRPAAALVGILFRCWKSSIAASTSAGRTICKRSVRSELVAVIPRYPCQPLAPSATSVRRS